MLLLTFTISTLFIHVPHKGEIGFLLNPEVKLSYNQYFWFIGQNLILITLAAVINDQEKEYRISTRWFIRLVIADFVIWVLSYDDPLKHYFITWNISKTVIFVLAIVYEWYQKRRISAQD